MTKNLQVFINTMMQFKLKVFDDCYKKNQLC